MNETTLLAGIVAAIVTILTKVIDALVARRRDRQSGSIEHRKLLSDDERAFRQAVLEEVKELREELDRKSTLLDDVRAKLVDALSRASDAERRAAESERRSLLLEAQVNDLRVISRKAFPPADEHNGG
jgi:hypothetical protein